MIKRIRSHKLSKIIASYLAIQMITATIQPGNLYALTSGPSQPEFNAFTPIGTSDMVNLSSGDFNYNIPIMDVGGYPLNLAYDSGINMDQEASWVGLGWNLNVGQINRQVRGLPDDFNGDILTYENKMKRNKTVGMTFKANAQAFGLEAGPKFGLTVQYNNYEGISFKPSYGFSWDINENVSVGMNLSTSATEGVSVSPSVNIHRSQKQIEEGANSLSGSIGVGYNSRQGLTSLNLSASTSRILQKGHEKTADSDKQYELNAGTSGSGSISFVNNTFTPAKRTAYKNTNITFGASIGADFWGIDGEVGLDAFATVQKLRDEGPAHERGFGYQFTENASKHDILDFNKEKDGVVSKNTLALAPTNYTYDLYSINGQGIGGMFRPFRGNVGYVYDQYVQDQGDGGNLGVEIEGATGYHIGVDLKNSPSESHTGVWETNATSFFRPADPASNKLDYESVYFKSIGELRVDEEATYFQNTLGGYNPVALTIGGSVYAPGKYARNNFTQKTYGPDNAPEYGIIPTGGFTGKLKRQRREKRNQSILQFTKKQVQDMGAASLIKVNSAAKPDHTAGMHILQPDGSTYIFGETAYNHQKKEASFAVRNTGNCANGTVTYLGSENTFGNSSGIDNYFNRVTTPAYAHTYLLSAVVSADYEDVTGDGLSDDDLGVYTKFNYVTKNSGYQWRIPYNEFEASFNEGLKTNRFDQKGSYVYGQKELKYIETIETKTHVAVFDISARKDGYGVNGENGGGNINTSSKMYKLNKISLYAKPEYKLLTDGNPNNDDGISPIKVAHFIYKYDLCKGVPNNFDGAPDAHEISNDGGKLTLDQVYFTYRDSKMGKYTPYQFHYGRDFDGDGEIDNNYPYSLKAYDVWGNYKPNQGGCLVDDELTAPEFPFVQQESQEEQNKYASAWSLSTIDLPSGGKLEIEYESDDYQYVQDKKAMQMFKVVGVTPEISGTPSASDISSNEAPQDLFHPMTYAHDAKHLIVEIPEAGLTPAEFQQKYIGEHIDKPIYFRFLLQMVKGKPQSYDYVEGYLNMDPAAGFHTFSSNGKNYGTIPIAFSDMEGGISADRDVNPISKAGWYFGRQFLNRQVYGLELNPGSEDIGDIARALGGSLGAISEIFEGPNESLRQKLCARKYKPGKSWIRLQHSGDQKLGGGVRVKKIQLHDEWDQMVGVNTTDEDLLKRYRSRYGQEYEYTGTDGNSSGVATYEPNMSKENPLVMPFYNEGEDLVAPREISYTEKPFGESFFPSPTVTYGRVTVKNLQRLEGDIEVKKHATGWVVIEFFTSKNFPTITDYTRLNTGGYYSNEDQAIRQVINGLLGLEVETETELTLSQGFVVRTNDMNGKKKKQSIYNEGGAFISGVDYEYSVKESGNEVNNNLPVIFEDGSVSDQHEIGVHYDVITDFRESYSYSRTFGVHGNVAGFIIGIFPIIIPTSFPERAVHEKTLHTTTTTKVIHSTGILKKKVAHDLGSRVSTENLAWDAGSGQVLLTKTINEYDDQYYSFTYPAHWFYENMGKATNNVGIQGGLISGDTGEPDNPNRHLFTLTGGNGDSASDIFTLGDELFVYNDNGAPDEKLWVVDINGNNVTLMNRDGYVINQSCSEVTKGDLDFRIVRSGFRNLQSGSMATVTSMVNPIDVDNDADQENGEYNNITATSFAYDGTGTNPRIINSSAIEFSDYWKLQQERNMPQMPTSVIELYEQAITQGTNPAILPENYGFNPYVLNARGDWKAIKSYAYLTGRKGAQEINQGTSPRFEGYFTKFNPYYKLNQTAWEKDPTNWTFASQVTQNSPFGAELENKDALGRFSAAQYGYNYTLPTAVGSNSMYRELGYDGFEDYTYDGNDNNATAHFGVFQGQDGTSLTDATSHSGRHSLKVNAGNTLLMSSNINVLNYEVEQPECPTCPPGCVELPDGTCDCGTDECPTYSSPYDIDTSGVQTVYTYEQLFGISGVIIDSAVVDEAHSNCDGATVTVDPIAMTATLTHDCPSTGFISIYVDFVISGVPLSCETQVQLRFCDTC